MKEILPDKNRMQRFLGMNMIICKNTKGRTHTIQINQSEYIDQILLRYGIEPNPKIRSPLPPNYYFQPSTNDLVATDKELKILRPKYRQQIGLLIYLSSMARTDIAYSVNYLAQFYEYPHPE